MRSSWLLTMKAAPPMGGDWRQCLMFVTPWVMPSMELRRLSHTGTMALPASQIMLGYSFRKYCRQIYLLHSYLGPDMTTSLRKGSLAVTVMII